MRPGAAQNRLQLTVIQGWRAVRCVMLLKMRPRVRLGNVACAEAAGKTVQRVVSGALRNGPLTMALFERPGAFQRHCGSGPNGGDRAMKKGKAVGTTAIGDVLGLDESNVRAAYKQDPALRQFIQRRGGRYEMNLAAMSIDDWILLDSMLEARRKGGDARRTYAKSRARSSRGRFASRRSCTRGSASARRSTSKGREE